MRLKLSESWLMDQCYGSSVTSESPSHQPLGQQFGWDSSPGREQPVATGLVDGRKAAHSHQGASTA